MSSMISGTVLHGSVPSSPSSQPDMVVVAEQRVRSSADIPKTCQMWKGGADRSARSPP